MNHLRDAAHHILYVTDNSRAHAPENLQAAGAGWKTILVSADIALGIVFVLLEVLAIRGYVKRRDHAKTE